MVHLKLKNPIPLDFTETKQGFGALLIGIIVALVFGTLANVFALGTTWIWWVLGIGVIVGILNIFHEEGVLFIMALLTLTFMLNVLVSIALFPVWAITLFSAVVYLIVPVAVVVSLKVLYALAVK